MFQSAKSDDDEADHIYKVFIPQKTFVYPPPPEKNSGQTRKNLSDLLNISSQQHKYDSDDVTRTKIYPLPPKKRWIPRGFHVNDNGATIWVTDVTCRQLTVTILESEDGYYIPQSCDDVSKQ